MSMEEGYGTGAARTGSLGLGVQSSDAALATRSPSGLTAQDAAAAGAAAGAAAQPVIFLRPIAAPSVLGLYGFALSTFVTSAWLANWFGHYILAPTFLLPIVLAGGVLQILASMWGFIARDPLAVAFHGIWGAFWVAFGILYILLGAGIVVAPDHWPEFGIWFIILAILTFCFTLLSLMHSVGMAIVLGLLTAGSICNAIWLITSGHGVRVAAGWLWFFSSLAAVYVATSLSVEGMMGRGGAGWGRTGQRFFGKGLLSRLGAKILPIFELPPTLNKALVHPGVGEPGVMKGQ